VPRSFILLNHGIAVDEACEVKPSWNAAVCQGDIGRLDIAGAPLNAPPRLPGAGGGGFRAAGPPPPPVTLSRNGKTVTGTSNNIRAGTEVTVRTERTDLYLNVTELEKDSWVILELPGFSTAGTGTPQDSLEALRQSSATAYYKGKDALWVKVVSAGDTGRAGPSAGGSSVQVRRQP
jgi:cell migration-inducing and hyaluronan-binding protein